jgi:hypothetical protein
MKEAYAVRRTVPPSAEIQAKIDKLLSSKLVEDPQKMLSELARLGAKLIIQPAVEEEFDSWLGRARYERRPERQRGLRNYGDGDRNGYRARSVQTGEGELRIEIPQAREAPEARTHVELDRGQDLRGAARALRAARGHSSSIAQRQPGSAVAHDQPWRGESAGA